MDLANWIGLATLISATVGVALAAYWSRNKRQSDPDEGEAQALAFTAGDRALIDRLRKALASLSIGEPDRRLLIEIRDILAALRDSHLTNGRRIDALNDAIKEARRATEDNTAALRRG